MKPQYLIKISAIALLFAAAAYAQSTEFTYQGKLLDGGLPANAMYDLQFRLFDSEAAGSQVGTAIARPSTSVVNGIFTVSLDFGAVYGLGDRWLELSVSPAGANNITTISPRTKIASVPQAAYSAAAGSVECTDCLDGTQIASVPGNKVSGPVAEATDAANLGGLPAVRYVATDAGGNVGIGATPGTGSKLTVGGQLELTAGGIKFPDASVQSSAGITAVNVQSPLTGDGTTGSPLGIQTPLTVINADNPSRQPFYKNTVNQTLLNLFVVPAGKALVVENVSGVLTVATTNAVGFVYLGASDSSSSVLLVPSASRDNGGGTTTWFFNANIRLYLTSEKQLAIFLDHLGTITFQDFRINGHLVDTP